MSGKKHKEPRTGREIYQSLCEARDLRRAIRKLAPGDLTTVAEFLGALCGSGMGDIPQRVWDAVRLRMEEVAR